MEQENKQPLIIFATFWNERFWIQASLAQIEALHPDEIIICDGCFDPNVPNYSTDGTREIIEAFVKKHPNARIVSAERPMLFLRWWRLLRGHTKMSFWRIFKSVRWKFFLKSLVMSSYRHNQAITFNHMISLSEAWQKGSWFMTCDADQYYSDEMIAAIHKTLVQSKESGLMVGHEITFFKDFNHATNTYEKRIYNNMPHRIYEDTIIQPTRGIMREDNAGHAPFLKKIWSRHLYIHTEQAQDVGTYMHYKINSPDRLRAGYALGDREEPEKSRCITTAFTGDHPAIVKKYIL